MPFLAVLPHQADPLAPVNCQPGKYTGGQGRSICSCLDFSKKFVLGPIPHGVLLKYHKSLL